MPTRFTLSAALAIAALAAGCAAMAPAGPAKLVDGVFVAPSGMTLYNFDRDAAGSGKSVCNGPCATNRPPLAAAADARADGAWSIDLQWVRAALPPAMREVLLLVGVEEYSYAETAAIRFGYVLSGELAAADLPALAREVYRQMARRGRLSRSCPGLPRPRARCA